MNASASHSRCPARPGLTRPSIRPAPALALAAALAAPMAHGQTFSFSGSVRSNDNTAPPVPPLISIDFGPPLNVVDFFAWKNVDDGTGTVTAQDGWTSLAGVAPARLTFDFGDLEILDLSFGPGTATEEYGNTDGTPAFFNLYQDGIMIATGSDFSLDIVTDTDPLSPNYTLATGSGLVSLAPVNDHGFVGELSELQGGSSLLSIEIHSFTSPVFIANPKFDAFGNPIPRDAEYFNDYAIAGAGAAAAVVPEPSTYGAIAASGLLGFAVWRRRRQRRTTVVTTAVP